MSPGNANKHCQKSRCWNSATWIAVGFCIAWTQINLVKAQTPEASVEMHGVNGDQWLGQWQAMDDKSIRIRSRLFSEPVRFHREFVKEILVSNVSSQPPSLHEKSTHTLHWRNGSVLSGILESEQGDELRFSSPRFGNLAVPRKELSSIESRESLVYAWSGNPLGWSFGDVAKPTWVTDASGQFVAKESNARAWLELELPDSFVVEMALRSESVMDFAIALGPDVDNALHLSTVGENVILGTSDDFEIGPAIDCSVSEFRFRMQWNGPDRKLALWSLDGKLIAETIERTPSVKAGLLLVNQGKDLSLVSLRVIKGTDAAGTSSDAEAQDSGDPSDNAKRAGDEVAFHDGDRVRGKVLGYQNGELRILLGQSETVLSSSLKDLRRIQFETTEAANTIGNSFLKIGGNRMQGVMEFGQEATPIRWTSTGQIGTSFVNTSLPGSIKLPQDKVTEIPVTDFRDLLYLDNGDIVPCHIDSLNESRVQVSNPFSHSASIPHALVKAIEFGRASDNWKHPFTRESRERLLTVPRRQRNDWFKHALLAANGDLLRGNLVSVDNDQIELDSRSEPLLIDRKRVAGIVFLLEPKSLPNPASSQASNAEETATVEETRNAQSDSQVRLILGDKFSLSVKVLGVRDGKLDCESNSLGQCSVSLGNIHAVLTGDLPWDGEGDRYSSWETQLAISPRWKQPSASPTEAAKNVGSKVEDIELSMLDGQKFRLSEHAGQVVILDFWATWCGPCVKALPEYLQAVQEFSTNDVMFLGVNSSETPDTVRTFLAKRKIVGFNTLFDYDGTLGSNMGVTGIPHTVIIGPDGVIEHVHVGFTPTAATELKAKVAEILGRK